MLHNELGVAVSIAREGGDMLLREFNRPGGPRRQDAHHAEIDREVERVIRERLMERYRRDGFLGEETGRRPPSAGDRWWIVDPNDGTAEFLRGSRGPSVSIALVEAGLPRVGVVFAYAAPDDAGDLFAGAEGQGLFRGPGRTAGDPAKLPPPCQRRGMDAEPRVAISYAAHRNPQVLEANAAVCAPWGAVPVPGIAYRLALAAAGVVRAGVTLTSPRSWDMAGGHALLRSVGGDLFDREGLPVRYEGEHIRSPSRFYVGGFEADVQELVARDWESLL